jgi:hypothetical protein
MRKRRPKDKRSQPELPRQAVRSQPPQHWLDRFEREREAADEVLAARLAGEREQQHG